jgi:hypothetical protein
MGFDCWLFGSRRLRVSHDSASAFAADNEKNTPCGSVSGTRRVCADFLLKASLKAAQRMKVVM